MNNPGFTRPPSAQGEALVVRSISPSDEPVAFLTTIILGSSLGFLLTHAQTVSVRWADDPGSPHRASWRLLLRQFHTQGHPSDAAGGFPGGDRSFRLGRL